MLALVYNLRRQGRGQRPEPPNYDTEQARVTVLLRQWSAGKDAPDDDSPESCSIPWNMPTPQRNWPSKP